MLGSGFREDDGFHKSLLDNLFDGVYYVDRGRRVSYWNRGAERISGYTAAEVIGRRCKDNLLRHIDDQGCELCTARCPLVAAMATRQPVEAKVYLHHRDGHRVPVHVRAAPIIDSGGAVVGAVEIFSEDVALRRARDEIEDLRRESHLDPVTGLSNRRALELALGSRLRDVIASGGPLGLLFVDVDRFKDINDRYGHEAGDRALRTVGATLAHSLRPSDVAGRWGGDEFLVLAPVDDLDALDALAERIRMLVSASTISLAASEGRATVSIGATLAEADDTPSALVARADTAMYRAKRAGRNRVVVGAGGQMPVPSRRRAGAGSDSRAA
jgi:diguanylate cyclase (GGDEF)-like protein/PAS domain S-box-containing protein